MPNALTRVSRVHFYEAVFSTLTTHGLACLPEVRLYNIFYQRYHFGLKFSCNKRVFSYRRNSQANLRLPLTIVKDNDATHRRRYFSNDDGKKEIRLSKRMSELDLCSRREADRLILDKRILVDGEVAEIGGKVSSKLTRDRIVITGNSDGHRPVDIHGRIDDIYHTAVVLNKPPGYVSGQAEHGYTPAVELLTRQHYWGKENDSTNYFKGKVQSSWAGYAPAGRLDLDARGLLVFSNGVIAKKLIASSSTIEKEYIVDVEPAVQPTRREHQMDPYFQLPSPSLDLTPILQGGRTLLGDGSHKSPLKPCAKARWLRQGERLQVVLTEGRKHHIRRMCREILGWHVTQIQRIRIGPIKLENLPEGFWRPLRKEEIDTLLAA